jgi:carboxylesterase type B
MNRLHRGWQLPEMVGTGPELQPLADKVSGAWITLARIGNPSHSGIPKWPAYTATERATMHIDNEWKVVNDPDSTHRTLRGDCCRRRAQR